MITRRIAAMLAVLALLVAACGGDDDATSTTTSAAPVTTSGDDAEAVSELPISDEPVTSARMEGSIGYTGLATGGTSPEDVEMEFNGAFDESANYLTMVMDMSSILAASGEALPPELLGDDGTMVIEVRTIDDTTYMRYPLLSLLGVTTEWVSFPSDGSVPGLDAFVPPTPADLTGQFEMYASGATEVTEVGTEDLNGVETTHYSIVADPETMREQLDDATLAELEELGQLPTDPIPVDMWIDADGLVHRMRTEFSAGSAAVEGGGFDTMTVQYDFLDHNVPIAPETPPANDVTDGSELGDLFGGGG